MKIHYLITSLETGGTPACIPRIFDAMRKAGHEVELTVCEPRDMGSAQILNDAGIPFHLLCNKRRSKLFTTLAFYKHIKDSPPDVIWTSLSAASFIGMVTGRLMGIPVVNWKHSASVRFHMRFSHKLANLWVGDSAAVSRYLSDTIGVPRSKIVTWPLFEQIIVDSPSQPWDGESPLHIGSLGRLHSVKNYDKLILAIAQLRQRRPDLNDRLHLTLVGEGPERAALEQLVAQHNLESIVSMPGEFSDVKPFLQTWHLYIQPSEYEGMCLALHEAMSAQLPVIASPVGEMLTSIQNSKGGILLSDDKVSSCGEAIELMYDNPSQLSLMGEAGRAYVERNYGLGAFNRSGFTVLDRVQSLVKSKHASAIAPELRLE